MAIYFIDYENVHEAAFKGASGLSKKDTVYLFYSNMAPSISLDILNVFSQKNLTLKFFKVHRSGKNYLDFQLTSLLGAMVATKDESEYVIISKDSGYDSVVDFWNEQDLFDRKIKCSRRATLSKNQPKKTATKKPQTENKETKKNENKIANSSVSNVNISKLKEDVRKKIRAAVKHIQLKPNDYTIIYKGFVSSAKESELKSYLQKNLKGYGPAVYKSVLPIYQSTIIKK